MNHINRDEVIKGFADRRARIEAGTLARRRWLVTIAKRLLPLGAIFILLALVLAPSMRKNGADRVAYHMKDVANASAGSHMQVARFHGVDQSGEPYTVTAASADQHGNSVVTLTAPIGDLTQKAGDWLMLKSDHGLYDQRSQALDLTGHVTLYRNDGTIVTAPTARINLKDGSASSSAPVQVQGPFGTLTSQDGFTLAGRGSQITFNGASILILTQVQ
jgi:lipopolysaccharide export system protein LptC